MKDATSTAIEPTTPLKDNHDPISRHVTHRESDIEGQTLPHYTEDNDPYQLASCIKSAKEIDLIRANTSRKRDGCGPLTTNTNASKARKIQGFYEA